MLKKSHKMSKKRRLLAEHPYCCFCGGSAAATTSDHVPPKACFPDGFWPEGFEFPACEKCNHGTTKNDQIFGFYAMLLDFNEVNRSAAYSAKLKKLREGIANNCPEALPNPLDARPVHRMGNLVTPSPVAISTGTPAAFREAAAGIGQKLTHALYYRERGKALSIQHRFATACYQIQNSSTTTLTECLGKLLPDPTIGSRSNIKSYGERFAYKSGAKGDDFFIYAAQFGKGLIVWGIVLGPGMVLSAMDEALRKMPWRNGAGGLGAVNNSSGTGENSNAVAVATRS
jgi:hypothetical protein